MIYLLSECHFWTLRTEADLGAKTKRDYTDQRSGIVVPKNDKLKGRLKNSIKKLEGLLRSQTVLHLQWQDAEIIRIVFSSGLIAHICIDKYTGDISRMVFEKYLVGKLAADAISDVFFTPNHIVLSYNTNQLSVVYMQNPNNQAKGPRKIEDMDPRIFHILIPGSGERKSSRHLAVRNSFDLFLTWTKSSQNEVFPWRPTVKDQDRANMHVFKLKGTHLESVSYYWTENYPLCVDFLHSTENQILTIEQKISCQGEIFVEVYSYKLSRSKMQRTVLSSIAMGTQICCHAFSPDQEKLFLGTIDRLICLHDLIQQTTKFMTQIDIIPYRCSWHSDSSIIIVGNDCMQFQCFDLALSSIANQLKSEMITPLHMLDISHYFSEKHTIQHMSFNQKPDLINFSSSYAQIDSFLLVLFENGPIGCIRFFSGSGMKGDIHNSGLTGDVFVDKYLSLHQLDKAVQLLVAMNWETYGAMCLMSLHKITNYLLYHCTDTCNSVELVIRALKTFNVTLSYHTKDEFSSQVFDLKRRLFFFLLRKKCYSDCFELAKDIGDYDLFMDLHNKTKAIKNFGEFTGYYFKAAVSRLNFEYPENMNNNISSDCCFDIAYSQSHYILVSSQHKARGHKDEQYHKRANDLLKHYVPPLPSIELDDIKTRETKSISRSELQKTEEICSRPTTYRNLQASEDLFLHAQNGPVSPTYDTATTCDTITRIGYGSPDFVSQMPISTYEPKIYQYPLVSGRIPLLSSNSNGVKDDFSTLPQKKPPSILLKGSCSRIGYLTTASTFTQVTTLADSKETFARAATSEKNKVKFCDTVQIAMVPETQHMEKSLRHRKIIYVRPATRNLANQKKKLPDSLPLCHLSDEYLKSFDPITKVNLN